MDAELRDIPGHPNYAVTRDGRVWSKPRIDSLGRKQGGEWLTITCSSATRGYARVRLGRHCAPQPVHRIMLQAFVGPRPKGMQCRHMDGDKTNNCLENLQWGTGSENQQDRRRHGTANLGEKHAMAVLNEDTVRVIFDACHDGYYTQREIAKAFGITQGTVGYIARKETWSHLWD